MADPYETLIASGNLLYNAAALDSANRNAEDALEQNQSQFDENMKWLKEQYGSSLDFAKLQHSEQMDFANRNLNSNIENANNNLQLQREAFDYQKELNNTQMEREDSAMQRLIADYKKAGFSPLAAIGSSGAGSSPLSSGAAPQRDMSGINQASGQYMDYAKQYAALTMQANQNYMNNRSQMAEKHNAEILAAKQALIQMKQDSRFKAQSMATEMFNASVNYRDSMLNRDYVREQTKYLEDKHKWEQSNGYRGQTATQVLVNALTEYLDSKKKDDNETRLSVAYNVTKEKAQEIGVIVKNNVDKIPDNVKQKINDSNLEPWQKIALTAYTEYLFHPIKALRENAEGVFNAGKDLYNKYIKQGK